MYIKNYVLASDIPDRLLRLHLLDTSPTAWAASRPARSRRLHTWVYQQRMTT